MQPIEAMAKAYMQADDDWVVNALKTAGLAGVLDIDKKPDRVSNAMRAAILALAECELPENAIDAGVHAYESVERACDGPLDSSLVSSFRAMLRSIANEGSLTPPKIMREDGNG